MSNLNSSMTHLATFDGAMCAMLVDSASGMILAKLKTMQALKLDDVIDDILITLSKQYHIIRPVTSKPGLFLYVVLDKSKSNLALARRKVQEIEQALSF